MFAVWKERRVRRRVELEARTLVQEAQLILKKKRSQIPEAVVGDIETTIGDVDAALAGDDIERVRRATTRLDEKMDEHLAFGRKSSTREYAESIGVAVAIALVLRAFVVEAFQIPSGSMIPTLEIGDHIFVSKFSYGLGIPFTYKKVFQFSEPKRGEIIVFRYPPEPETDYIKRVVGLPGERVEVKNDEVFINGRAMPRDHVGPYHYEELGGLAQSAELWLETLDGKLHRTLQVPGPRRDNPEVVVPAGHVFVMGDNRDNSRDSRDWGFVPAHLIKGRALMVWWSRGPTSGGLSLDGIKNWVGAIRWRRFFSLIE